MTNLAKTTAQPHDLLNIYILICNKVIQRARRRENPAIIFVHPQEINEQATNIQQMREKISQNRESLFSLNCDFDFLKLLSEMEVKFLIPIEQAIDEHIRNGQNPDFVQLSYQMNDCYYAIQQHQNYIFELKKYMHPLHQTQKTHPLTR